MGVDVDLAGLEQPREQVLFCNYCAGSRRFWDAYMGFCEPVYHHILTGLDAADRRLIWSRADREIDSPYVPFIMERLFSTFLALRPDMRFVSLNAEAHAVRGWRRRLGQWRTAVERMMGTDPREAALCEQLSGTGRGADSGASLPLHDAATIEPRTPQFLARAIPWSTAREGFLHRR